MEVRHLQSESYAYQGFLAASVPLRIAKHHALVDRILFAFTGADVRLPTWDEENGFLPRPKRCCHSVISPTMSLATELVFQYMHHRIKSPLSVSIEQYMTPDLTLPTHIAVLVTVSIHIPIAATKESLPLSNLLASSMYHLRHVVPIKTEALLRHAIDSESEDDSTLLPSCCTHNIEPKVDALYRLFSESKTCSLTPTIPSIMTTLWPHQRTSLSHLILLFDNPVEYVTQPPGTIVLRPEGNTKYEDALVLDYNFATVTGDTSCLHRSALCGGVLADAPTTGKTLTMLSLCLARRSDKPNLILCPSHLLKYWHAQIRQHLFADISVISLATLHDWARTSLHDISKCDFVLASFAFFENRKVLRTVLDSEWEGTAFVERSISRSRSHLNGLFNIAFQHIIVDEFAEFTEHGLCMRLLKMMRSSATWLITHLSTALALSQDIFKMLHRTTRENTANRIKTLLRHTVCSKEFVNPDIRYRWVWVTLSPRERIVFDTTADKDFDTRTAALVNLAQQRPRCVSDIRDLFRYAREQARDASLLSYLNEHADENEIECPICMTSTRTVTMFLRCGHVACEVCCTRWVTAHAKCIVCRTPFESNANLVVVGESDDSMESKMGSKLAKLLQVIEQYPKIVIYLWSRDVATIAHALRRCEVGVAICAGNINQRERNLRLFHEDPQTRILMLSDGHIANGLPLPTSTMILLDTKVMNKNAKNIMLRCVQPVQLIQLIGPEGDSSSET